MILPVIALLIHCYVTYITLRRINVNGTHLKEPLYDIIHSLEFNLNDYKNIIDIVGLLFIIPLVFNNSKKKTLIYFINIFSIIAILRSFALLATDVPKSDTTCDMKEISFSVLFNGHCNDKIFSNHTSFTLLAVLIAYKFDIISQSSFILLLILQIIYAGCIVLARNHYSVDVLLSYYIVLPLYYCITYNKLFED